MLGVKAALLKFRLPYYSSRYPEVKYLDGILHLPVWGPQTTTECRLLTTGDARMKLYNVLDYNERMFYFNTVSRGARYGDSECGGCFGYSPVPCCYDCNAERSILASYMNLQNFLPSSKVKLDSLTDELSDRISINLNLRNPSHCLWPIEGRSSILCDEDTISDAELNTMKLMGLPLHFKGGRT